MQTRVRLSDMIVRSAQPEDALRIATIHVEAWRVGYRAIVPDEYLRALSIEQRQTVWRQILASGESVWVAEDGGKIKGWISAARSRDVDASQLTGEIWAVSASNPNKTILSVVRHSQQRLQRTEVAAPTRHASPSVTDSV